MAVLIRCGILSITGSVLSPWGMQSKLTPCMRCKKTTPAPGKLPAMLSTPSGIVHVLSRLEDLS